MTSRRLLLIGLGGADWALLAPLLSAGRLPRLDALRARGSSADLTTRQPHSAAMQWTTLATGVGPLRHGILEYLTGRDDTVRPVSSLDRGFPTLWQMLALSGIQTCVLNWPLSHPVEPVGVMVSDLFAPLPGPPEDPGEAPPGAVYPATRLAAFQRLRYHGREVPRNLLRALVPAAPARDGDPALALLASRLAEAITVQRLALTLLRERAAPVMVIHHALLEALAPVFMPHHGADPAVNPYAGVITGACRWLDAAIGELLDLAGPDTLVAVVSAHGTRPPHEAPPPYSSRASGLWARDPGMVLLAGPGIVRQGQLWGAGIEDLLPTLLTWFGLPLARQLEGRVWREVLAPPVADPGWRDWAEALARTGIRQGRPDSHVESAALDRLRMLGLVEAELPDAATLAGRAAYHRALALLEAGRARAARPLLEWLHHRQPGVNRYRLHLARCLLTLGERHGAENHLEALLAAGDRQPRVFLLLAGIRLAGAEYDAALALLFEAEQANPREASLHSQIGETYLALERHTEAERGFRRALALQPRSPRALVGLARVQLARGEMAAAAQTALDALALNQRLPQAHLSLGQALLALGERAAARTAVEAAARLAPRWEEVQRQLLELLEAAGEAPARQATLRRRLARLGLLRAERELRARLGSPG